MLNALTAIPVYTYLVQYNIVVYFSLGVVESEMHEGKGDVGFILEYSREPNLSEWTYTVDFCNVTIHPVNLFSP